MKVVRIPTPEEGNPLHPLPLDYPELDQEGQRQARVNATRQWLLPTSAFPGGAIGRAVACVAAHRFFDAMYLQPDGDFDPGFYDDPPLPTPLFHMEMVGRWHTNRLNADTCPRGSAKSTRTRVDMIHRSITRPTYNQVYATSNHDNCVLTGQKCREQCFDNERIHNDFAPEYGGRLRPVRGAGPSGIEYFQLGNGSIIKCVSANSRLRGLRPHRFKLDDPEFDEKASTSSYLLRQYMEQLLFGVVLPMVMRAGSGCDWTNTFVSKRHYAYHAMQVVDGAAVDPRFNYWHRTIVRAFEEQQVDGRPVMVSCWPEMWPIDPTERETLKCREGTMTLPEIREAVGTTRFNSEYMARPGDTGGTFFPVLTEEKHGYRLTDVAEDFTSNPRNCGAKIHWNNPDGTPMVMPLPEFLTICRTFIMCDASFTSGVDSDYKTAMLVAHYPVTNTLFVLDLWAGQVPQNIQVRKICEMADRWHVGLVCPEVVKASITLYNELLDISRTRAMDVMGLKQNFTVMAIKPGMEEKVSKIASLQIRFEHGTVKLPLWKQNDAPWWMLFEQIEQFNPEAGTDAGLQKDDCLDTLSMSKFVLKGRRDKDTPQVPMEDAAELLAQGKLTREQSMGLPLQCIPSSVLSRLLESPTPNEGKSLV